MPKRKGFGKGLFSRHFFKKRKYENMTKEERQERNKQQRDLYKKNKKDKDWRERNNELQRIRMKEIRIIWKKRGLCTTCGKERESPKFLMCYKCRKYSMVWKHKKNQKEVKNNGKHKEDSERSE